MKISFSTWIKIIVGVTIAVGLTYYLSTKMNIDVVINHIKNAEIKYILLAILFSFISHISRGLRWFILLEDQGYKVSKIGLIAATYFGYFINILIPRGGELARCSSINYKYGLPTDKLIGTIVLERVIDFFMLMLCAILVLSLNADLFGGYLEQKFDDALHILDKIKLILTIVFIMGVITLILLFKNRTKSKFTIKLVDFISGIFSGLKSIGHLKRKGLFIFHTLFIWFLYILMSFVPFYSFEGTKFLTFSEGMFTFVLGGIGMTIPSPGGAGSYQTVVSEGMNQVLNIDIDIAAAYSWSIWGALTISTLFMGIIVSIYLFKGKKFESNN